MAVLISLFLENTVSKTEFFDFLKSIGGCKQKVENLEQGFLEYEEAAIWFYYRGTEFNLDVAEKTLLREFLKDASIEIALELSSNDGSDYLAEDFCKKMGGRFGNFILFNNEGMFFNSNELKKALYIE